MSGHSKWSSIKHKKAAKDAKRGKIFTKLMKEIMVAARIGGGDISANPRLKLAVDKARSNNMPKDNIEKAIKKGTGELEGSKYEEVIYEGYGPGGVAIIVEAMTDNKNRTTPQMRTTFSKYGGNFGESGSVAWMFHKKGVIMIPKEGLNEDDVLEIALEAGADDMNVEEEHFVIETSLDSFSDVKEALEQKNIPVDSAELTYIPDNYIKLDDEKKIMQCLKLVEMLEENDDVQNVHTNLDIPDDIMKQL